MGAEKRIENDIKKILIIYRLRGTPLFHFKVFQTVGSIPGIPDINSCINGYYVTIEVKAPNNVLSDEQVVVCNNVADANGVSIGCSDYQEFVKWLDDFIANPHLFLGKRLLLKRDCRREIPVWTSNILF